MSCAQEKTDPTKEPPKQGRKSRVSKTFNQMDEM
jgi:hypothetical protein